MDLNGYNTTVSNLSGTGSIINDDTGRRSRS